MVTSVIAAIAGLTNGQTASLLPLLYTPHADLSALIEEMDSLIQRKRAGTLNAEEQQRLGYTLEKFGLLTFQNLTGASSVKSCQTAGPQLDLLVNGMDVPWLTLCKIMLNAECACGIVVEAKATKDKVGDAEFQRMGSILSHHLGRSAGLGVFLSIEGATGFPTAGQKTRSVQSARLTQLVIYHSLKKPIVVLEWEEMKELSKPGSLVTLIARKVQEIEEMVGVPTALPSEPNVTVLPDHLQPLCRFNPQA